MYFNLGRSQPRPAVVSENFRYSELVQLAEFFERALLQRTADDSFRRDEPRARARAFLQSLSDRRIRFLFRAGTRKRTIFVSNEAISRRRVEHCRREEREKLYAVTQRTVRIFGIERPCINLKVTCSYRALRALLRFPEREQFP